MDIFFNSYEAPTFAICAQPHFQAPSDEGAVERSETEGEKTINIKLSLSLLPSRLRRATFLVRGRLYSHIIVNLIVADNRHISVNFHGGSKPPPYAAKNKFDIYCFTPSVIFLRKMTAPSKMGRKHKLNLI